MISKRFAYVATLAALVAPLSAQADDRDKAKKEMTQGVEAYDAGNFIKAKMHFQKASEYAPTASGPFRELGKACQELRQWNEAKTAYQTYLSLKPDAEDAAEIQGYLAEVEREIAKMTAAAAVPGALALNVNISGAEISIDGEVIGTSPLRAPYKLAAGDHRLVVKKEGFEEFSSDISISEGEEMRLKTTLVEAEGAPRAGKGRKTGLGFGLLATGGAGLAAGIIGGVGALNTQAEIDNIVDNNLPVEFADFQALVDQGELFNVVTIAGYAVAAVGVGGGLYFLLRGGSSNSDGTDGDGSAQLPRWQLTPMARGAGLRFSF